jgi:hypothetical protein
MTRDPLIAAWACAVFASDLSAQDHPDPAAVSEAIKNTARAHGGLHGCAGEVAAAYGEHPETAAPRMRWARALVETSFVRPIASRRSTGISLELSPGIGAG